VKKLGLESRSLPHCYWEIFNILADRAMRQCRSGFGWGGEAIGGWARESLRLSGLTGEDYRSMGRCWGTIDLRLWQIADRLFGARAAFVKLCRVGWPIELWRGRRVDQHVKLRRKNEDDQLMPEERWNIRC
jgi:hypothetical protein